MKDGTFVRHVSTSFSRFRATLYECPATAAKRREMALAITGRIDDLNMVRRQARGTAHYVLSVNNFFA